jgi:hypothetical protein
MISALKYLGLLVFASGLVSEMTAAVVPLVNHGDTWRYHKGTTAAQSNWKTANDGALDASWLSGPGGFGYGDGDDATVLSDMQGASGYTTVFIRREFQLVNAVDAAMHLRLTVDWDDAYVAYLDGVEIARSPLVPGGAGTEPPNTAAATGTHEASGGGGNPATVLDLGVVGSRLGVGVHVLAVLGLNESTGSSDFSLIADLAAIDAPVPPLVSAGSTWRYFKGTTAPQAGWTTIPDASLNGTWLSGPGGFGYADNDDATVLSDMRSNYTTVYIRQTFNVASPFATNLHAVLTIDFDDGFVAYLDGVEIGRQLVPGAIGVEPGFSVMASQTHEASGGSGGNAPLSIDLGRADLVLPPGNHILAMIGVNESLASSDLSLIPNLSVSVPPPPPAGSITVDTTWTAAGSPYVISNNLTVVAGVTLTIEPGVTLLFDQGRGMTINGRLLAEGTTEAPITFTRNVGATTWSQLAFTANNTTSRIAHADMSFFSASAIEATATALNLDSIRWTDSTVQVVDLHDCSIVLLNSFIPGGAGNEPVHFSGMPANGHALIKGCVFGAPRGYNDSIDFTGGNRPGPIAQFIDNVFLAAVDDCFDMDATDAHIEGNIFMNVMQDAQRDSSSNPITTGEGNGISELYICRNIFFNCEHTLLLKDNGSAVVQNNTVVHLTTNALARNGSGDPIPPGIILFGEPWRGRPLGSGAHFEGNIAYDLDPVIQATPFPLYDPASSFLVATHNLIQGGIWPGEGNITGNPLFVNVNGPMTPATIRSNLMLMAGSPCIGAGPNGLDMGALVPAGASVSGVPSSPSSQSSLTVRVAGPGIVAYRWSLNNGSWSPEIPLTNSFLITSNLFNSTNGLVQLTSLTNGTNTFRAIGKNSAGFWQDTNAATTKTWVVETTPPLRIAFDGFSGGVVTLSFVAQAGQTYSLLYKNSLDGSGWQRLKNIPAQPSTGTVQVTDDAPTASTRFYQLVTPMQP